MSGTYICMSRNGADVLPASPPDCQVTVTLATVAGAICSDLSIPFSRMIEVTFLGRPDPSWAAR